MCHQHHHASHHHRHRKRYSIVRIPALFIQKSLTHRCNSVQLVYVTLQPLAPVAMLREFVFHRSLLAAASGLFRKVDTLQSIQILSLSGIMPHIFDQFFQWVYTGGLKNNIGGIPALQVCCIPIASQLPNPTPSPDAFQPFAH